MFGTDIDNKGIITSSGDIKLINSYENIIQALNKRLLTLKGAYYYFDNDFGTILSETKGYKKNSKNLEYICLIIETEAVKDNRISKCKCSYKNNKISAVFTLYNGETTTIIIEANE
jgi:hypothetical protein